jgi:ABC-2 type transport system ATP-binding protein
MADAAVLSLRDVTIRYGAAVAVDALCLEVSRGEVFGLLGPNGSGKSSTLAAVAGTLAPAAGEIRVLGVREPDSPLAYRRHVGVVPQELAFFEELTAEANLLFFGRLYGLRGAELKARVAGALECARLTGQERRPARTLSGGMQRRLNLACALLHEPPLLLLDEPTVGLDVRSRDAIFASLRLLRDQGRALVFTTHHLEEAEELCDRIGIMDHGRLAAAGTLRELCAELPAAPCGGSFQPQNPDPEEDRGAEPGAWRLKLAVSPAGGRGPSLERVFRRLTGRSRSEP